MRTLRIPQRIIPAVVIVAFAACKAASGAKSPAETAAASRLHTDSAGGLVVAPSEPYVTGTSGPAGIVVSVAADSGSPAAQPASGPCEVTTPSTPPAVDALFWIDGIRHGKRLSDDRRYELVSAGCALAPRVQAVLIGGAIDVVNDSPIIHRLIFLRAGTNDTLQTMPFSNDGQVVASDRLTRTPGIVEVRCAQHPQERAYIAVFDHPYFGVGSAGERVSLDSIPPGDYQLRAWREGRSEPTATATKVGSTGQTQVVVR